MSKEVTQIILVKFRKRRSQRGVGKDGCAFGRRENRLEAVLGLTGIRRGLTRRKLQSNPQDARRTEVDGRADLARHDCLVEDILHSAG